MREENNLCHQCIKQTGGCCTDVEFSIHVDEAEPFLKAFENAIAPEGHILEKDKSDPEVYEYSSNEEPCMFLDDNNRCSIYERRPTICRTYPILWAENKGIMNHYLDCSCPLAQRVSLQEIRSWVLQLPKPEIIEKIGELDVDIKDPSYINLTVLASQVTPPQLLTDPSLVL